jgi:hypothetical protein
MDMLAAHARPSALEHANMMAERMQKANDEEYLVYWQ